MVFCKLANPARLFVIVIIFSSSSSAQQTNNSSSLTNSAAPSASSVTTGGTNINYQTNNTYQNEFGFGPGVFCRTPTLYIGANWGEGFLTAFDPLQKSGNANQNYAFNAGLAIPFGSQILDYCKQLASAIAKDREISSQLSMLRTCAQLEKEGLVVDPLKFPMLEPCAKTSAVIKVSPNVTQDSSNADSSPIQLKPKTVRLF